MHANGLLEISATAATAPPNPKDNAGSARGALAGGSRAVAQPIVLLGVSFDNLTIRETLSRIEEMIVSGRPHYVVTANVDFLAQARRDLELQRILLDAPLVVCDGKPLVWASRLLGNPLPERVAGADIVPELIALSARKDYRVFFLGTTEKANQAAVARLQAQFPNLQISHYSPPFRPLLEMDDAEIVRRIRSVKPHLLFVAFGCPKAEKWMAMHYRELGVPVAVGIGGTIDFLAGRVKRAPVWMQHAGIEWVYRLCQEPRRLFRRYAADLSYFGRALLRQYRAMRPRTSANQRSMRTPVVRADDRWQKVQIGPCLDRGSIERDAAGWQELAVSERHCLLDLEAVEAVDSTGLAALVRLQKQLRRAHRNVVLLSPSASVRRALRTMRLGHFFEIATDAPAARAAVARWRRERRGFKRGAAAGALAWLGEVTTENAEQIWQRTWAAINSAHFHGKSWIIDLAAVRFMDTSGLKLLLRAAEAARRCGVRLRFNGPSAAVRHVLRLANLEHLLDEFA